MSRTGKLMMVALALSVTACAQAPKPGAVATAPASPVTGAPAQLASPAELPAPDPEIFAAAQRDLKLLGYPAGKTGEIADPLFQKAILAFEKDQGLAEDGRLSPALLEKLKLLRAELLRASPAAGNHNAVFVFGNGVSARQPAGLLITPPGLVSDAPANFMQPVRPGSQSSYRLGKRAKDGSFKPALVVTCQAGRILPANMALGLFDAIVVDCRSNGPSPLQWRSVYSVALGIVIRQETAAGVRDLVAMRPFTGDWPSAARTGLDWALTHALEAPAAGVPVQWSSTGVAPQFEIRAGGRLSGQEAGLSGANAAQTCRRFEMTQSGSPALHYPGLACQIAAGVWSLPGNTARLAAPSNGITLRALPATASSARN